MRASTIVKLGCCVAALVAGLTVPGCAGEPGSAAPPGAAPAEGARPGGGSAGAGRPGAGGPVPVTVAVAAERRVPIELQVIGTVEAHATVQVRSQITGALTAVTFREGDDVAVGQELFTLDRRPLEAALRQAEATLARDQAQAANARASAGRYQDLATRGIATREQVEQTRTSAAALDATVESDRAAVENATVQLQYATIRSPLSGRTGALMVNAGNLVRANDAAPLVVINQISPVFVSFAVPEARLAELKRAMARGPVVVAAIPPSEAGPADAGRVTFVDNLVDRSTGTIRVKATFPNGQRRLWPGQFVNVTVTLDTIPQAVVMPTTAVQTGPQGQYVYVVSAGGSTVALRPVVVNRTMGAEIVVSSGVRAGETVVTDGQVRLTPGARISVKSPGADAPGRKAAL